MRTLSATPAFPLLLVAACASTAPVAAQVLRWPDIKGSATTFRLTDGEQPEARLIIEDTTGKPLYLLECYLNAYEREDSSFDYSGDFECRLTSLSGVDGHATLLSEAEHATRDWESRGRFLLEELAGSCGDYPDYGRVRNFSLRGMKLTLEVLTYQLSAQVGSETHFSPRPQMTELNFKATVSADTTAVSEVAAPTPYVEPPRAHPEAPEDQSRLCDTVLVRELPSR